MIPLRSAQAGARRGAGSSAKPRPGKAALRSARFPACGFRRLSSRQIVVRSRCARAQCGRKVRRVPSLFARIGRLDDRADRVLIEPFEAAFALQILQMASDSAFADELAELLLINESLAQQSLGPLAADRPSFSFRKG